jgi:hypothetical protein
MIRRGRDDVVFWKEKLNLTKKTAELQVKAGDIEDKAAALPANSRRTYQEELARLGFEPTEGIFNDGQALSSGAPEEMEDAPGGLLGLLAGIFGGGNTPSPLDGVWQNNRGLVVTINGSTGVITQKTYLRRFI